MVATHNIKVNGRWVRAGEAIGETAEPKRSRKPEEKIPAAETPETESHNAVEESPKPADKPRTTTSRRKKVSE